MLKNHKDTCQSMTIQSIDCLPQKNEMESEKTNNSTQNKNGHISFSVASLLADTRPSKSVSPQQTLNLSSPTVPSSDEEYDSNQEDSIVDVEDLNAEQKSHSPSKEQQELYLAQTRDRDFALNQGPIRPTPFSALAAAVYQAAHPNWATQGLVGHFPGPSPMFQGPTSFGVPSLNSGNINLFSF